MKDFIGEYRIDRETALGVRQVFLENEHLAQPGMMGEGANRDCKDSMDLDMSLVDNDSRIISYIEALNRTCLAEYKSEYEYCDIKQSRWGLIEAGNIQRYPPGGGFKVFHFEKSGHVEYQLRRHLVYMTFLSDIPLSEGGGTEFLYQNRIYPCSLGSTLIWPAEWTHTHRGVVSTTRDKMIVTGWYSYVPNF